MKELRIAHVSDTHLGYRYSAVQGRDQDFAKSWIEACRGIVSSSPDIIIHSGDLFHHPHPSWGAVASFMEGVYILRTARVPIVMISGNHDSSRLLHRATVFTVLNEMFPEITILHDKDPLRVPVDNLETDIVLISHRGLLNPLLSERMNEITASLDTKRFRILVAHGDVKEVTRGEDNEQGSVAIPKMVFDYPWDYIALGHLHMAQPFGPNGWYAGSTERCGWSDYPADPAWCSVTLSKTKGVRHTQQPIVHREMRQLQTIICGMYSDFEVIDEIVLGVDHLSLTDEAPLVRVILDDISNSRVRVLERAIRDAVKKNHPRVVMQVAVKKIAQPKERFVRESKNEKMTSIEDMFKEFIGGRTYPDAGMQERILEKGLSALRKAREDTDGLDTGDERSVANG